MTSKSHRMRAVKTTESPYFKADFIWAELTKGKKFKSEDIRDECTALTQDLTDSSRSIRVYR